MALDGSSPETFASTAGISSQDIAALTTIGSWVMPPFAAVGMVLDAIAFVELLSGDDPVQEGFDRLDRHLQAISDQITLGEHRARLTKSREEYAKVATLALSVQSYLDTGAADHRDSLVRVLSDPKNGYGPMLSALGDTQANQLPHAPTTYPDNPDWMSWSLWVWMYGALLKDFPALAVGELPAHERAGVAKPLGGERVYILRPFKGEMQPPWGIPEALVAGKPRWDGRYAQLPLMLGAVFAQNAMQAVEPYYRTTGHYHWLIVQITDAVTGFVDDWEHSLLITADMPAPPDANSPGGLGFGFGGWHCGACDPMSGASLYKSDWWIVPPLDDDDLASGGLMGQDQVATYQRDRDGCLARVRQASGLNQMKNVAEALKAAIAPPDESPSLSVFDDRPQLDKNLMLTSTPTTADTFDLVVPPTTYEGTEEQREVLVRIPIAIQGDPGIDDVPNVARTAASDVTFGYSIELGESPELTSVFEEKLRQKIGEEGIWHTTQKGLDAIRTLPYATGWRDIQIEVPTYRCFTDPSGSRRRVEDLGPGQVNIRCQVTIGDTHHTPIPGESEESRPRGVLWLELHSTGTNPSFELPFVVTELTNVGPDGSIAASADDRVRYTSPGSVMVDARVTVMPIEYHDQWEKEHKAFYDIAKDINYKYVETEAIGEIGPPDDIVHGADPYVNIRNLLDNPKWSAQILEHVHQTAGVQLSAIDLHHGFDRLNAQRVMQARQSARRIGRVAPPA